MKSYPLLSQLSIREIELLIELMERRGSEMHKNSSEFAVINEKLRLQSIAAGIGFSPDSSIRSYTKVESN